MNRVSEFVGLLVPWVLGRAAWMRGCLSRTLGLGRGCLSQNFRQHGHGGCSKLFDALFKRKEVLGGPQEIRA